MILDVGRHHGREVLVARVDPAHRRGQRPEHLHQRAPDVAVAEHQHGEGGGKYDLDEQRCTAGLRRVDQHRAAIPGLHPGARGGNGLRLQRRVAERPRDVVHGHQQRQSRSPAAADALDARKGHLRPQAGPRGLDPIAACAVDQRKRQRRDAAAALPEPGRQRKPDDPGHGGAGTGERVAGDADRLELQVAAADGAMDESGADQHGRASLARHRTRGPRDRHRHGTLAAGKAVAERPDPVSHCRRCVDGFR